MSETRYITFVPHEDNINETISAEDINELQDAIIELQSEIHRQSDEDFIRQCIFTLQHSSIVNAMTHDTLEVSDNIDISKSSNIIFAPEIGSVIQESSGTAKLQTKFLNNPTTNKYGKVLLLVNQYVPVNSSITYEISYDDIEWHAITPGDAHPLQVTERSQIKLRATMNSTGESLSELPRLDGWALLYQDEDYMFRFLEDGLDIDIESAWDGTIIP